MADRQVDAIVIGAGQAGGPLAGALARAGRRVVLVEQKHVGGTCINEGCTPTKTMIASGRVAHLAMRAADYGVRTGDVSADVAKVRERKRSVVLSFRAGSERKLAEAGVELLCGVARFVGERTAQVTRQDGGMETLSAEIVVIDTGTRPAVPPLEGLQAVPYFDSTSIMELDRAPEHLLVLGGGYVGLEFAQLFRRFGSRVTVIQRDDQLLTREDPDVAGAVAEILNEDGIEVLLSTQALRAEAQGDDRIRLVLRSGDEGLERSGSHLLVATGRTPSTDGLDPGAAGVETDPRGFIRVNARLETSAPGVFAAGDVTGGPQFTHISYDDFRVLRANLLEGGDATVTDRPVPYTVFLDPQLGRVGLTETQAREQGLSFRVARLPMRHVARAIEIDETRGFIKALVDARTDRIVGCAVLGVEGGEIMSMLQLAMMGGLPRAALRDAVFAHPTLAELLNNLFADAALSTPPVD